MRAVHGNAFLAPGILILASSNQSGGSLGAALLNTIAASAAATYLIVLFAVGAIVTALLYPRRKPAALA